VNVLQQKRGARTARDAVCAPNDIRVINSPSAVPAEGEILFPNEGAASAVLKASEDQCCALLKQPGELVTLGKDDGAGAALLHYLDAVFHRANLADDACANPMVAKRGDNAWRA